MPTVIKIRNTRHLFGPAGEWEESQREGRTGAGLDRLEDMANVHTWLPAPVMPEAVGGGRLGPVPVPPATRYRLLAWQPSDATLSWSDFMLAGCGSRGRLRGGRGTWRGWRSCFR